MAESTSPKTPGAKSPRAKTGATAKAAGPARRPKTANSAPLAAAAAKRTPRIPAPEAPISGAMPEEGTGTELKKQELIDKVVEASGVKKKDAKPVVEAMLEILGEALAEGRELNLQPLGKLKLNRTRETANARILVVKLRQSKNADKPSDPLAAAAE